MQSKQQRRHYRNKRKTAVSYMTGGKSVRGEEEEERVEAYFGKRREWDRRRKRGKQWKKMQWSKM